MRILAAICALMLLAGCERSFDDRFADAQKAIDDKAGEIDRDIATQASASPQATGSDDSDAGARQSRDNR